MDKLRLKIDAISDAGVARIKNEDSFGIFEKDYLFIVCDGMGGHQAGAVASNLAVETTADMYAKLDETILRKITIELKKEWNIASRLIASIRLANRMIFNQSCANLNHQGMGTTISALAIVDNFAISAHVGDSRIYRFRKGKMELLTEDHTWVNELIFDKEIDANQAGKLKNKNVITRALGLDRTVKIDLRIDPLLKGDSFLLCTDGLIKALSDDEIKRIVIYNKKNLSHTLKHLIDNSNMIDGSDNSTVIMFVVENNLSVSSKNNLTKVTLKAQDKRTTRLENNVLKKYYSKSIISDQFKNKLKRYFN